MAHVKHNIKAIIYDKRGRILSVGENSYVKTHPIQAKSAKKCSLDEKIFLHAEISAIIKCKDLSKAHSIFVSRPNRQGGFSNAKPCPICMHAINTLTPIKVINHT